MFDQAGRYCITAARTLLLGAIVLASADYGLTRESGITRFNQWAGVTFVVWLVGLICSRRLPRLPLSVYPGVVGVLVVGGLSTGLAWVGVLLEDRFDYPAYYDKWLIFGAIDFELAVAAMIRTSALLGVFLVALDLFSSRRWTRALILTWAVSALGMVLFFALQRTVGGPFQLSSELSPRVPLAFAGFRYWGNAASYLNLSWPLLAAVAAHLISADRARGWTLWLGAAAIVFASLFLNVSKAGNFLGAVGAILFAGLLGVQAYRRSGSAAFRISPATVLACVIPLAVIVTSLIYALPKERWESLMASDASRDGRVVAYGYFVQMLPDASWLGFGPGNFKVVYWDYVGHDPIMRTTPFWVAHQDYLQTVTEWGYAGTAFWAWLFLIPSVALARLALGRDPGLPRRRDEYAYSWTEHLRLAWEALPDARSPIVAVGASVAIILTALHAIVDFPMQIASLQFYFLLWMALGWSLLVPSSERKSAE